MSTTNQVNSVANSEPTSAGAVENIFAVSGHFTHKEKLDSIFTAYIKKDGSWLDVLKKERPKGDS
jgi:hypothetical protein